MIQSYTDAVNLLRMIALQDGNVQAFFVGEDERITQATRSSIDWPVVWLEYADGVVRHEATGHIQHDYLCKIYVLGGEVSGDEPAQESQLRTTEDILKLMLLRLRSMHKKRQIRFFIEGTSWRRVAMATPDNAWGWEMNFRIGDVQELMCVDGITRHAVATLKPTGSSGSTLALGIGAGAGGGAFDPAVFGDMFDLGGGATSVYEVAYDGSGGKALELALHQLAEEINGDVDRLVDATAYGDTLFLRAITAGQSITIDITQGDFTWVKQFEF